jgi:hypothetical protein
LGSKGFGLADSTFVVGGAEVVGMEAGRVGGLVGLVGGELRVGGTWLTREGGVKAKPQVAAVRAAVPMAVAS